MPHEVATRRVLYEIPGMDAIVPQEFEFPGGDGQPLPGRIYGKDLTQGVVVIVEGYPDPGFVKHVGCRFMDMQWSISMAQLIAASGMTAMTYANRQPAPDAKAALDYAHAHAARVAIWATSGHAPVAIGLLDRACCAVLSNPVIRLHEDAPAGQALPDVSIPIFVVRSGKDETPGLNAALDTLIADAVAQNYPITLVNHPDAPHAFELYHDSATTRLILRQALDFLR